MKKKIILVALLIVAHIVGATFVYKKFFKKPEIRILETGRVERGDIRIVLVETGIIKSQVGAVVKIGAPATGKVDKMHVKVGDRVQA